MDTPGASKPCVEEQPPPSGSPGRRSAPGAPCKGPWTLSYRFRPAHRTGLETPFPCPFSDGRPPPSPRGHPQVRRGTSVSSPGEWLGIAKILRERQGAGERPLVVHSALSGGHRPPGRTPGGGAGPASTIPSSAPSISVTTIWRRYWGSIGSSLLAGDREELARLSDGKIALLGEVTPPDPGPDPGLWGADGHADRGRLAPEGGGCRWCGWTPGSCW